jgi:hypothetical protein
MEFHVGVGQRIIAASVVSTARGFEKIELVDGEGERFSIDLRDNFDDDGGDSETREIEANYKEL